MSSCCRVRTVPLLGRLNLFLVGGGGGVGTSDCHCGGGVEETLHLVILYFFDKLGGINPSPLPAPPYKL